MSIYQGMKIRQSRLEAAWKAGDLQSGCWKDGKGRLCVFLSVNRSGLQRGAEKSI